MRACTSVWPSTRLGMKCSASAGGLRAAPCGGGTRTGRLLGVKSSQPSPAEDAALNEDLPQPVRLPFLVAERGAQLGARELAVGQEEPAQPELGSIRGAAYDATAAKEDLLARASPVDLECPGLDASIDPPQRVRDPHRGELSLYAHVGICPQPACPLLARAPRRPSSWLRAQNCPAQAEVDVPPLSTMAIGAAVCTAAAIRSDCGVSG